jgi:hypothetical protein
VLKLDALKMKDFEKWDVNEAKRLTGDEVMGPT